MAQTLLEWIKDSHSPAILWSPIGRSWFS